MARHRTFRALATAAALLSAGMAGALPVSLGPFRPEPALTLYLVSDGEPCGLTLTYTNAGRGGGDRLLTRLFDAEEKLRFRRYETVDAAQYPVRLTLGLLPQEGVHQLRIIAGANNSLVEVELERPMEYGVCGQRGTLHAWDKGLAEAWVYVPPQASVMELRGGPLLVDDDAGKAILQLAAPGGSGSARVQRQRTLLRLRFPDPSGWSLQMRGFPFIVCPTRQAAEAIHASVEELPDGTVVHHKFQAEIASLLPELLAPKEIGSAEVLTSIPPASREARWLLDPLRNQYLLGSYGFMEHMAWSLRMQDVDPNSPTSGAITLNKGRRPDPYAGGDSLTGGSLAAGLARAATLNAPFSPYYGRHELLYRAAACALRDLMLIDEDETFKSGSSSDMDAYPTGCLYFPLGHTHCEPFSLVGWLPPPLRALWAEALERPVDRMLPVGLVSCRNQSAHGLTILWHYYMGSRDERFREAAEEFGNRFLDGMSKGCFDMESCGPDATYQGMTDWHKGYFYRLSGDKGILESLRSTYRFFNHTVAPEPDGSVLGASNFSHRTAGSFADEQWGGAKGICDDVLPEVGIWARPRTDEARAEAEQSIRKRLASPFTDEDYATEGGRARGRHGSQIPWPRYLYYTEQPLPGTWPAAEQGAFIRNFGDEMIAVKRRGYYCVVYVGKPAPSEFYINGKEQFRKPLPRGIEDSGGLVEVKPVTPYLGGGLSMFWTPGYGNGVLAMNWSPLTHHGVVVRMADTTRWWEEYFATAFALDEAAGTLVVTGEVEAQPLAYERRYVFGDEALSVELTVTAREDFECASMIENIPLALGSVKPRAALLAVPREGRSFSVRDTTGAGIECAFDGDQRFRAVETGLRYRDGQVAGRVEVALSPVLKKGQRLTVRYQLRPV